MSGLLVRDAGHIALSGTRPERWTPREAIRRGIARIPEDRHKTGTIAGFNLTENAVLEAGRRRIGQIRKTNLATIVGLLRITLGLGEGNETMVAQTSEEVGELKLRRIMTGVVGPRIQAVERMRFDAN